MGWHERLSRASEGFAPPYRGTLGGAFIHLTDGKLPKCAPQQQPTTHEPDDPCTNRMVAARTAGADARIASDVLTQSDFRRLWEGHIADRYCDAKWCRRRGLLPGAAPVIAATRDFNLPTRLRLIGTRQCCAASISTISLSPARLYPSTRSILTIWLR
jgi:hypothetical protein